MKRWIGGLHGGQLVMVLFFVTVVGLAPAGLGVMNLKWSNEGTLFATSVQQGSTELSIAPDLKGANAIREGAYDQAKAGLGWIVVGLFVWATMGPIVWIWFGARRELPIEVIVERGPR